MPLDLLSDPGFWISQTLNALQLSMLLFLLSVGLTVIFGLMNFVNLAHGGLYALGAYIAYTVAAATGSFWLGALAAPLAVAAFGAVLYATLIDRMRAAGPMNQVLVTFGLLFILLDALRFVWGADHVGLAETPIPGRVEILGEPYPLYRLFVIALGLAVYAGLHFALERSRLGAEVRAGVDDAETARCLGVEVDRVFFRVFLLGCGVAGLAGAAAMPVFAAAPSMAVEILAPALAVVVIGGLGSLHGAMLGALLIGAAQTFGQALAPAAASMAIYALLAVVLLSRPEGLIPVRR